MISCQLVSYLTPLTKPGPRTTISQSTQQTEITSPSQTETILVELTLPKLLGNCKGATESRYPKAKKKAEVSWEESKGKLEEHPKKVKPKPLQRR